MDRLPDFVIIGAMKCATSTLHEQLARQPGIFMSTKKEPDFFSDDRIYERGEEWYRSLFQEAQTGDLCGESSTHYTKRPRYPKTLERMTALLPDVKLVYVMRHPIERLISHYIHEWTTREVTVPLEEALDTRPDLIACSRYAYQLEPFIEAYGFDRILPVFQERLIETREDELRRIYRFVGGCGEVRWQTSQEQQNVSSQRLRKSPLRDALLDAPLLRTIRRRVIPPAMRDRVKQLWQMRKRPELLADDRARLETLFDQDLAKLGDWLGRDLSCGRFRQAALEGPATWRPELVNAAASAKCDAGDLPLAQSTRNG